ncbi:di-heme oxidoredictase family protein [Pseudoalteromonas luteoviolacea]|nr:di-heme oxidoredictase family protein [Pseudoalteromonas luteoviolacea]
MIFSTLIFIATISLLVVFVQSSVYQPPAFSQQEMKPAGESTARRVPRRSFIEPIANEDGMILFDFWDGFSFFRDPWVAAPSITRDRDGLGPLYNARSCKACHNSGGRGKLGESGEIAKMSLLFRFLKDDGNVDSRYGGQLQPFSVRLSHSRIKTPTIAEGQVIVHYDLIEGKYDDGTPYTLRKPRYELIDLGYGKIDKDSFISARYAPAIYGMGLLDAINEEDLLAQEDTHDKNKDGISAKYNRVENVKTGELAIGRFGFKGLHPTLEQQVAGAFLNDIGITNPVFKSENCLSHQTGCNQAASIEPASILDIPKKLFEPTLYMSQTVTVPPARKLKSKKAQQGRKHFYQLNCNGCHTPSYTTSSDYPVDKLANQKIWPYTNLALHDMGEGLADRGTENQANGSEWRTPPLWGIGLQKRIQGFEGYLHDGRAKTIEEAVLWHSGEAKKQQQAFKALSLQERESLIYFLKQI